MPAKGACSIARAARARRCRSASGCFGNGQPAALYLRPCQSTEDITPVALLLLRDLYGDLLTPVNARRMIQPEA